jgi:exodeoxyribonuclease V alpha subunit
MAKHLSVRICWHDSGWNGSICKAPLTNHFCSSLEHIREHRDKEMDDFEIKNKEKHLSSLQNEILDIPCKREICVFSDKGYSVCFDHPLKGRAPGYELAPCSDLLTAYCCYPAPYRWLMVKNYNDIRKKYGLSLRPLNDSDLSYSTSKGKKKEKTWIDDPKLQEILLTNFWDAIEDKKSFVVFYVNSSPVAENQRRVIVGIGRVKEKGKMARFGNTQEKPGPNYAWQRRIVHNYPAEGFRLPYQEYLEQGVDPQEIILTAPENIDEEFKYVSEHVSDGAMLALAEQADKVISIILNDIETGKITLNEDWEKHRKWVQKIIGELWESRGQYPGIGSVLRFLGFSRGMTYHQQVLVPIENENGNSLEHIICILDGRNKPEDTYVTDFSGASAKWKAYSSDPDKRALLELLMRMEISEEQAERIMKEDLRFSCGITASEKDILSNPYLISENDKGTVDKNGEVISPRIGLEIVDHAMVPAFMFPSRYKEDDDRRVRAIMIEALQIASEEGDTLLSINELMEMVQNRFPGDRQCLPDLFLVKHNKQFYKEKLTFIGKNDEFLALNEMRELELTISDNLKKIIDVKYDDSSIDWQAIMQKRFKDSDLPVDVETRARKEKESVLNMLYHNKFSVLTGRAGTGKTEVLNIFIDGLVEKDDLKASDFLILAPTGKARVRIKKTLKAMNVQPKTIHQHLKLYGWLKNLELKKSGGEKTFAKTIIVDEASMMAVDLFATLIKSIELSNVTRFILVGDPNQLPPIGPGRPFDDIVKWLKDSPEHKDHLGLLSERVRQKSRDSICLNLADGFLRDFKSKDVESIYNLMEQDKLNAGDLHFTEWKEYDELMQQLEAIFKALKITDYESYKESVGIDDDISKCESWQILSPVKYKEVSGTIALNTYFQNKFLGDILNKWRTETRRYWYPKPFGDTKDVVWHDKVIQTENKSTLFCKPANPDKYVANGEIGIVKAYNAKPDQLKVAFSDQPEYLYYYYDGNGNGSVETNLDLAYAITIHKSQGSDFEYVILVIPQKAFNISMEMMYTALTRFKEKTFLLVQGGIDTLQEYRKASNSETDGRNTFMFKIAVRDDLENIPYAENRIHKTKNGFLVRSKSEVIIANELINAGIPLTDRNYEAKLYAKNNAYIYKLPDFTFTVNGKEYYWEHLGMLSLESYKRTWEKKLQWYKDNGYFLQLIISQDGLDGGINSQQIIEIIKERLQ